MLPVRGATVVDDDFPTADEDFNPCSPCGERQERQYSVSPADEISIHAPRAGSDPHGQVEQPMGMGFQSMLPVRGATGEALGDDDREGISIHAPRAGSDMRSTTERRGLLDFNPCSPCGERPEIHIDACEP